MSMCSLIHDLWPFGLKINSGHLLCRMYQCTKFEDCQVEASQDIELSGYAYFQFDPLPFDLKIKRVICYLSYVQFDSWPFDLKIDRVHLLCRIYQCTKIHVWQERCSQDIEWTVYSYLQCWLTFDLCIPKLIAVFLELSPNHI
jgi:hypothetical protein